jgi:hypothetical protein
MSIEAASASYLIAMPHWLEDLLLVSSLPALLTRKGMKL